MNKNPRVSLIIPIYNVSKFIEKCVISALQQTYNNVEIIFVNDCTPDDSIIKLNEVLQRFPNRIKDVVIINHDSNKGLAQSRNTGVKKASGEYVMHLDSDDYLEPDTIEKCVNTIIGENADAVIFGFRHIFKNYNIVEHIEICKDHTKYINQLIRRQSLVCMCGGLYKRSLYTDFNIYAIPGLNMGEDYSTKPRLLYNAKKVVALDEPLYCYNHTNEGSYTQHFSESRIKDIVKAISVLREFFKSKDDYSFYCESLDYAALSSKVVLLKNWAISKSGYSIFEEIKCIFDNIPISIMHNKIDLFILILCNKNLPKVLRHFIRIAFYSKSIFKRFLK